MGILVTILVVLAIITLISWTVGFLFQIAISAIFWAAAGYIAVRVMGGDTSNWLQIIVLELIESWIGNDDRLQNTAANIDVEIEGVRHPRIRD